MISLMVDLQTMGGYSCHFWASQVVSVSQHSQNQEQRKPKKHSFVVIGCFKREPYEKKKKTLCYVFCKNASFLGSVPRFEKEMTSKWLYLFEGSGVAYGPINDMKNVFTEPQVWFLKFLVHGS